MDRKDIILTDWMGNQILKKIFDTPLTIDATDGTKLLYQANDLFGHIDNEFWYCCSSPKTLATPETKVAVYQMVQDSTFAQMFGSFLIDVNKLCFTQGQIMGFVKQHRDWLQPGRHGDCGNFFLFESVGYFFVADVREFKLYSGDYAVFMRHFESTDTWDAIHRLVIPMI